LLGSETESLHGYWWGAQDSGGKFESQRLTALALVELVVSSSSLATKTSGIVRFRFFLKQGLENCGLEKFLKQNNKENEFKLGED